MSETETATDEGEAKPSAEGFVRASRGVLLSSLPYVDFTLFSAWVLYASKFTLFYLTPLAILCFLAFIGLLRLRRWGLWLSYAVSLPLIILNLSFLHLLLVTDLFSLEIWKALTGAGLVVYVVALVVSAVYLGLRREEFKR